MIEPGKGPGRAAAPQAPGKWAGGEKKKGEEGQQFLLPWLPLFWGRRIKQEMTSEWFTRIDKRAMPCHPYNIMLSNKTVGSLSKAAILQRMAGHWSAGARWWVIAFAALVFFLLSLSFLNCPDLDPWVFLSLALPILAPSHWDSRASVKGQWVLSAGWGQHTTQTHRQCMSFSPCSFPVCAQGFLGMFLERGRQGETQGRKRRSG